MAQELAFAAPGTEEITKTITGMAGAGVAGVLEGVVVKMTPELGPLAIPLTWGTLLGVPLVGAAGALFSKGMIGDLFQGVALGGTAIAAYVLPSMLMPEMFGKKSSASLTGGNVKQLNAGPLGAPQMAQNIAARAGLEF